MDTKFTNWSNFVREAWLIDKRKMEQVQLFETADERGCTPMFGAAHRRESARIGGSLLLGGMRSLARFLVRAKFTNRSNLRMAREKWEPNLGHGRDGHATSRL